VNAYFNKSDYRLIVIAYVVLVLLTSIDYYRREHYLIEYLVDIPSTVITSLCVVLLFMCWIIPNFLIKRTQYLKLFFFSVIILFVFGAIEYSIEFWTADNDWSDFPKWHGFIIASIFRSILDSSTMFGLLLTKKFYESQSKIYNIEKQQKESELKLLHSQVNPHFLFNTLNALDVLIDINADKAKEYVRRLSLIYRYLIKTKDAEVMELSLEMDFAQNYIFLMNTRFENDYRFEIIENVNLSNKFIPTGAIQILLENVIKHNKVQHNVIIDTKIVINEDWLIVSNLKSKMYMNQESLGTGLSNLTERYKLLSSNEIQVKNRDTSFEISIPIIKLSD
jgi:hypothetical protein